MSTVACSSSLTTMPDSGDTSSEFSAIVTCDGLASVTTREVDAWTEGLVTWSAKAAAAAAAKVAASASGQVRDLTFEPRAFEPARARPRA